MAQQDFAVAAAAMTSAWIVAVDSAGEVRWFDRDLRPVGTSVVEGGSPDQLVAHGAGGGVCLRTLTGLKCAAGPGSKFTDELDVAGAVGRYALCPDGSAALAADDVLHLVVDGQKYLLPAPMGEMPAGIGPVIHRPSGAVAVPIDGGTAVRLLLPHGNSYDLTTLREFTVAEAELPGGVLGLALARDELYVAARGGRLHAIRIDAVPESTDLNWSTEAMATAWLAGPVVTVSREVLVVDENHDLLRIDQVHKGVAKVWACPGLLAELHVVPGDGVSGLRGNGAASLAALAPARFFPWLPAGDLYVTADYSLPDCQEARTLDLGGDDGRALVACTSGLRLVVPPAPADAEAPWPTTHGSGGSGCFQGE